MEPHNLSLTVQLELLVASGKILYRISGKVLFAYGYQTAELPLHCFVPYAVWLYKKYTSIPLNIFPSTWR